MTRSRPPRTQGFTLLELLLVLGVITAIVSLGVPSMSRLLNRAQFKEGVLSLQSQLAQARIQAMKSGEPFLFRFTPQTGRYQILPKSLYDRTRQNNADSDSFMTGSLSSSESNSDPLQSIHRELPNQVLITGGVFSDVSGCRSLVPRRASSAMDGTIFSNDSLPTGEQWSEPILFYPNGRTSNAVIFLSSGTDIPYYSEIALRGMTGAVRVSSIEAVPPGDINFPSVLPQSVFTRLNSSQGTFAQPSPAERPGILPNSEFSNEPTAPLLNGEGILGNEEFPDQGGLL